MDWRDLARCSGRDSDIFFDERRKDEALAICKECPVLAYCGWECMRTRSEGVWGGTTYEARRKKHGHDPVFINWSY